MKALSGSTKVILCAVLVAAVVVSLGAFTRLVDAGLGSPDWPGCYGHLLWPNSVDEIEKAESAFPHAPVDTAKTWPEMVHRYFASGLGLLILCFAVFSWRHRHDPTQPLKLPLLLLALVILQGLFGMWTVTLKLWPQVVTAHLLGGFATLSLLWLLFLRLWHRDLQPGNSVLNGDGSGLQRARRLALLGLVVVVLQISLGGWTTSNYAALACADFPTCHGEWLPAVDFRQGFDFSQTIGPNYLGGVLDNDARTAIHWSHRVGALVVCLVLLLLSWRLFVSADAGLRKLAIAVMIALVVQVSLGVTNIVAVLPLPIAVAHNGMGAILLLVMVTVNYRLVRCTQAQQQEQAALMPDPMFAINRQ